VRVIVSLCIIALPVTVNPIIDPFFRTGECIEDRSVRSLVARS
jgi:hypothetical protein